MNLSGKIPPSQLTTEFGSLGNSLHFPLEVHSWASRPEDWLWSGSFQAERAPSSLKDQQNLFQVSTNKETSPYSKSKEK